MFCCSGRRCARLNTSIAQRRLQRYGIRRGLIWGTFAHPIDKSRFHLIGLAHVSDGDLMRQYVYHTVLYSDAFESSSKQGWTQIDKGIGDLEAGIKRIEKDRRCSGGLLNFGARATLISRFQSAVKLSRSAFIGFSFLGNLAGMGR